MNMCIPTDEVATTDEAPDERNGDLGAGLVEYAMLTALIALVALASLQFVASSTEESVNTSASVILESVEHP